MRMKNFDENQQPVRFDENQETQPMQPENEDFVGPIDFDEQKDLLSKDDDVNYDIPDMQNEPQGPPQGPPQDQRGFQGPPQDQRGFQGPPQAQRRP